MPRYDLRRVMSNRPPGHRLRAFPRTGPLAALLIGVAVLAAACGGPTPTPNPPSSEPSGAPSPPVSPGQSGESPTPTPPPSAAPSLPTQSETSIGRIWDALPPTFPLPTGAEPTEVREPGEPASGTFAVPGSAVEVATALRSDLEAAGFATAAASGPFEDGSYVIESTGTDGCRIRSTIRPMGDLTVLLVRYGAACPFE